jgi:hypothetical protein
MHPDPLSRALREFISHHIGTVEDLDILLLMWRAGDRWWRADELATQLHMTAATVRRRLEQLSGKFLDVRVGGDVCFRFAPNHDERAALVAELAAAYKESRMEVIGAVLSGRAARHFADAFRIRKNDE